MKTFPPKANIDPGKRARIFGIANALGIIPEGNSKDGSLYDVIENHSKKRSISGLTNRQADAVIADLESRLPKSKRKNRKSRTPEKYRSVPKSSGVRTVITPDQIAIIDELIAKINKTGVYQFTRDGRAQYQFKTEFTKLTRHQGQAMIEGLKAIYGRVRK